MVQHDEGKLPLNSLVHVPVFYPRTWRCCKWKSLRQHGFIVPSADNNVSFVVSGPNIAKQQGTRPPLGSRNMGTVQIWAPQAPGYTYFHSGLRVNSQRRL